MPSAPNNPDDFKSVQYTVKDKVAHILLNRPEVMNAIDANMPLEIEKAVEFANFDDKVKVKHKWVIPSFLLLNMRQISFY